MVAGLLVAFQMSYKPVYCAITMLKNGMWGQFRLSWAYITAADRQINHLPDDIIQDAINMFK